MSGDTDEPLAVSDDGCGPLLPGKGGEADLGTAGAGGGGRVDGGTGRVGEAEEGGTEGGGGPATLVLLLPVGFLGLSAGGGGDLEATLRRSRNGMTMGGVVRFEVTSGKAARPRVAGIKRLGSVPAPVVEKSVEMICSTSEGDPSLGPRMSESGSGGMES